MSAHITLFRKSALFFLLLLALPGSWLFAKEKPPQLGPDGYPLVKTRIQGAEEFLNIEYLPEWRYSGDRSKRRDAQLVLDLWVPEGREACPLVVYVHGGAYSEGSKYLSKGLQALGERLVAEGIAFAAMNYILQPKGIRPQVWYDYRDAARYLRMHAERYRLDPTKFGAYGMSAGGWLITTAGHGTGDYFTNDNNGQGIRLYDFIENDFKPILRKEGDEASVWTLMQNEQPGWPGVYGGWQAVAFDFKALDKFANPGSPVMLDLVGEGFRGKRPKPSKRPSKQPPPPSLHELIDSGAIDYSFAEMTAPKFKGKNVHVPPLIGKPGSSPKSQNEHALTKHVVGQGEAELADVVVAWFKDRLDSTHARAPVPEIWPAMRIVDGPVEVRFVVPKGEIRVLYTTDGSEPGPESTLYTKPFQVEADTVVKALALMPNRKPSGIAVATYVQGPVPPRLLDTERELPPAETGKPYHFTFRSSLPDSQFWIKGDVRPYTQRKTKTLVKPNGMSLDRHSGVWSGTPSQAGRFWIQVAVQAGPGQVATLHNFTWTVSGENLEAEQEIPSSDTDRNVVLIHFKQLQPSEQQGLQEALDAAGLDAVMQEGAGVLLLLPKDQIPQGRRLLEKHFDGNMPAGAEWMTD